MPATDSNQDTTVSSEAVDSPSQAKWKYATKTALSLTLAYLIPMGMSWPQPSTAAVTVMLITATGLASDSLQKGVMRVLGTIGGALIGLTLIALFPQERMAYLLAASFTVAILAYLYNAYQGDSTLFMLAIVVTLMVFNGGDAEGAFIYGVDRAFMTAFGVIVYTVVASTLWPVRAVDNTRKLATEVVSGYRRAFTLLVHPVAEGPQNTDEQLTALLASEEAFQTHFAAIKRYSDNIEAYMAEWNCVVGCCEELQSVLLPALRQESSQGVEFSLYLKNYDEVVERAEAMFRALDASWKGHASGGQLLAIAIEYRSGSLRDASHLTVAAVATRAELLDKIQQTLLELTTASDSMLFDRGNFTAGRKPRGRPRFIWLDLENLKTSIRMFTTFWLATVLWIFFNPPLGFSFVALCSILVLLVSYTPVTPKLLIILFTMGFIFALPAYVFLLPQMTHWIELALFMFTYAFIGFYVFQGPVSIFFLLGLFALGIQNTMSYNFDVILLVVMSFYMMCTLLIVTIYFPFTSKPERLYSSMLQRFFQHCAHTVARASDYRIKPRPLPGDDGSILLAKLHTWGVKIDSAHVSADSAGAIAQMNQACDLLQGQVQVLLLRRAEFAANRLIVASQGPGDADLLAGLCDTIGSDIASKIDSGGADPRDDPFDHIEARVTSVRDKLDELRQEGQLETYERVEIARFFVYLNLRASILDAIRACREAQQSLDWDQLSSTRF